jgi:hypothetical protein
VTQRGIGEDVGRLVPLVPVQHGGRRVLRAQDVVAEQPLQRRGVADRALLELGDEDGGAVLGAGSRAAHVRNRRGHLPGAARADGEHAPLLAGQAAAGVGGGHAGERDGVGTQAGEQHLGDGSARRQAHEIEAEGGGTDQRVRHDSASRPRFPRGGSAHAAGAQAETPRGPHPIAGGRWRESRVFVYRASPTGNAM